MTDVNVRENQIRINDLDIHFKTFGKGDTPVVLLHGWGIDSEKYTETAENLILQSKSLDLRIKVIIPDLPGFGKSGVPKENWNLDNYVDFTDKFIETVTRGRGFEMIKNILKNITLNNLGSGILSVNKEPDPPRKFILIGHSFGGRIAIKYAARYPEKVEKLILAGAAGIKHPLNPKQRMFFAMAKIGKAIFSLPVMNKLDRYAKIFLYKAAREKDYINSTPKMKEIMKNVIDENLLPILDHVRVSTLLLWGRSDRSTPLADGNSIHDKIKGSEMIIFDDANHSLPYQKPDEFAKAIIMFIKK